MKAGALLVSSMIAAAAGACAGSPSPAPPAPRAPTLAAADTASASPSVGPVASAAPPASAEPPAAPPPAPPRADFVRGQPFIVLGHVASRRTVIEHPDGDTIESVVFQIDVREFLSGDPSVVSPPEQAKRFTLSAMVGGSGRGGGEMLPVRAPERDLDGHVGEDLVMAVTLPSKRSRTSREDADAAVFGKWVVHLSGLLPASEAGAVRTAAAFVTEEQRRIDGEARAATYADRFTPLAREHATDEDVARSVAAVVEVARAQLARLGETVTADAPVVERPGTTRMVALRRPGEAAPGKPAGTLRVSIDVRTGAVRRWLVEGALHDEHAVAAMALPEAELVARATTDLGATTTGAVHARVVPQSLSSARRSWQQTAVIFEAGRELPSASVPPVHRTVRAVYVGAGALVEYEQGFGVH